MSNGASGAVDRSSIPQIVIKRRFAAASIVRRIDIFIDDRLAGRLWPLQKLTLPVEPGLHRLIVRAPGRTRSNTLTIDSKADQTVSLECGWSARSWARCSEERWVGHRTVLSKSLTNTERKPMEWLGKSGIFTRLTMGRDDRGDLSLRWIAPPWVPTTTAAWIKSDA